MSASSRYPTHHIPDDGTQYAPGEIVRVDRSSGRAEIVKDPNGDYEIVSCRSASEYGGDHPPLRINLRRREAARLTPDPDPWATRHWNDR